MTSKSASSKHKPSPNARGLERLTAVRRQREPFARLSRRLIASTLERYLPAAGRVIEIGMGDGQLWERLPAELLPRILHTEPDATVSRAFRKAHPSSAVIQASAERLPLEAGSAAAVLGLCVLDVVHDGAAVAEELARVLAPGGRFIHFLDMSTVLTAIVADVIKAGLVPFPNFFSDPMAGAWPEDLFLVPREQLALIVEVLAAHDAELVAPVRQYLSLFSASSQKPSVLAAELAQLQESSELRRLLKQVFRAAYELADAPVRERLAAFQGRPVSSARHFEQRLRTWFSEARGFQIEHSQMDSAWERVPRTEIPFVYMSCAAGEQRSLPYFPQRTVCPNVDLGSDDTLSVLELGVFVFVATRLPVPG